MTLRKVRFGRVAALVNERAGDADFRIGLEAVEQRTGRLLSSRDADYQGEGIGFRGGDVLFGKLRPYLAKVWRADRDGAAVGDFHVYRPVTERVDPDYLKYCLLADSFISPVSSSVYGAKMPRASWDFIRNVELLVPSIDEQRAIADFLDRETAQIDTLIAKQQRLIATLRERRAAVVDRETSASGSAAPLRRAIESLRQGWSPVAESDSADGVTEWAVLKVGCTNSGIFDATQNKRLPAGEQPRPEHVVRRGEVVISRSNTRELVGAAAAVLEEYPKLMLSDLLYGVTPIRGVNAEFLAYALQSGPVRTQIRASAKGTSPSMQKISQADIRNLVVRIPPLAQQIDAAARIRKQSRAIDTLIQKSERLIELSQERRAALITAAVTGQIDVRKAA